MAAPPARTEISDTAPNPSNAVARTGFGKLWDYVTGLLGATGNATEAQAALKLGVKGANVASASSPNIWTTDGDTVHITGTTTITGFAAAPRAGARKLLCFDGAVTLTTGSNLIVPGGANYTTAAGDLISVYAETTTKFRLELTRIDGPALSATQEEMETGTEATLRLVSPLRVAEAVAALRTSIGTKQNSTSGTALDFTGIPATAKRVTMNLQGVSLNATAQLAMRIGDSGGIETSGYDGSQTNIGATAGFAGTHFDLSPSGTSGAAIYSGQVVLDLLDPATNTWTLTSLLARTDAAGINIAVGYKALSAALDRVQLTTVAGTATFDAGMVNILVE
jgi:hypothetical protein